MRNRLPPCSDFTLPFPSFFQGLSLLLPFPLFECRRILFDSLEDFISSVKSSQKTFRSGTSALRPYVLQGPRLQNFPSYMSLFSSPSGTCIPSIAQRTKTQQNAAAMNLVAPSPFGGRTVQTAVFRDLGWRGCFFDCTAIHKP